MVAQKQIIFDQLKGSEGYVPTVLIQERTGVPSIHVKALSNIEKTRVNTLIAALDDRVIAQLRAGLPQLDHIQGRVDVTAFDQAIATLKQIITLFTEMGGRPIESGSII